MSAPEDLLERIRVRLDESFVGIGAPRPRGGSPGQGGESSPALGTIT